MCQWRLPPCSDYPAYCSNSLFVNHHFICTVLSDCSPWETCSLCLWSFSSLQTQAEGPGQATVDGAQCVCVGAVYRIPLSGQECTAWLWNPPHGCDSLFWAGFPSNLFEQKKKNTLFWPGYPNKQVAMTCCRCLFIRNRAGNDVTWNLAESGIYFTWVLLSKSHTMTHYDCRRTVGWDILTCRSNNIR